MEPVVNLRSDSTDIRISVLKGLASIVPLAGGVLAEALNTVPNQRLDRVVAFLEALAKKVDALDADKSAQIKTPQGVDLLEDCVNQAGRSMTEERTAQIASLMTNALSEDQLRYEQSKRLLTLFGQLTDYEVLMLRGYLFSPEEDPAFWGRHGSSLTNPGAHLGSSDAEVDAQEIYDSHKQHLIQLGLLRLSFRTPKRGETPELDERTGMLKASGNRITHLGRLLLKSIGHAEPLQHG